MVNDIINMILLSLDSPDVKNRLKSIIGPFIDIILVDIYPYIYISVAFIITCFLLLLGIFIILIHHNTSLII